MLDYYFFKYWKQGIVGLMISIVTGYFAIFAISFNAAHNAERKEALEAENQRIAAQLSITPSAKSLLSDDLQKTNSIYKKSLSVYEHIQDLKEKQQDTSKLETLFAESVKKLSDEKEKEAVAQLDKIETEIAKLQDTIVPEVSGTPAASVSPSLSVTPSVEPEVELATNSADIQE